MTDPSAPGLVSSFVDQVTAETAAAQAIKANAGQITKWLEAGEDRTLLIHGNLNRSVGKIVTKEGVSVSTSSSAFFLRSNPNSPAGYYIQTGFQCFAKQFNLRISDEN